MGEVDGREVAGLRARAAPAWATILIGEAPSRISDPHQPLVGGRSGLFLARLAGLEAYQLVALMRPLNLLPTMPSPAAKRRLLRAAGARLLPALDGRRVVVLGRDVAAALGAHGPFFEWGDVRGLVDVLPLPHPSGRSRLWDEATKARAADLLRAEAVRAAEGAIAALPDGCRSEWMERVVSRQS